LADTNPTEGAKPELDGKPWREQILIGVVRYRILRGRVIVLAACFARQEWGEMAVYSRIGLAH